MEIIKDSIKSDLEFRKLELALIRKNCYMRNIKKDRVDLVIKYTPVSIYSILEGFFVKTMECFVDYLNRNIDNKHILRRTILVKELEITHKAYSERNQLNSKIDFLTKMDSFFSNRNCNLNKRIKTEGNVNLKVINKNFKIYGISEINDGCINMKINKLLKFRNSIAHGENHIIVDRETVDEFISITICVLDLIYDAVINGLENRCYLN